MTMRNPSRCNKRVATAQRAATTTGSGDEEATGRGQPTGQRPGQREDLAGQMRAVVKNARQLGMPRIGCTGDSIHHRGRESANEDP